MPEDSKFPSGERLPTPRGLSGEDLLAFLRGLSPEEYLPILGGLSSGQMRRLLRELSPEELNTVLNIVMVNLRPLHEQLPEALKGAK